MVEAVTGREAAVRELWAKIEAYPGLAEGLKVTEEELRSEAPCICLVDGVDASEIQVDEEGVFTLVRSSRGEDHPHFATDDARAFAVKLAFELLRGRAVFYPGHSPYADMPPRFAVEQRLDLDEYEIERVVVRWSWGDGCWAEILRKNSLIEGLDWAWMFTSSDQTIADAVASRDGRPLFRPSPGPKMDLPRNNLQNLTLEEWRAWLQERLGGEHHG